MLIETSIEKHMTHLAGDREQIEAVQPFASPPVPEVTWQSVTGALLISTLVAGSYPYVVRAGFKNLNRTIGGVSA